MIPLLRLAALASITVVALRRRRRTTQACSCGRCGVWEDDL